MFFWRRMLVEAFGAASPHPLLGFPWRSCKTSTMVLCTTKCGQEKGEGKDLSSRWCHCSPSRSFITVSSALSFHPAHGMPRTCHHSGSPCACPWLRRVSPLKCLVTNCIMAETHWHSHAESQPPCIPCSVGWAALQVAACHLSELLWQPVLINICFAQSSEFTCELKCD